MKKITQLLFLLTLVSNVSFAQTTETFEDDTDNATSFTDNGKTFNITTQTGVPHHIESSAPSTYGVDNSTQYIDNSPVTSNVLSTFTIASSGFDFAIKELYLLTARDDMLNGGKPAGDVTITGKKAGVVIYTFTIANGNLSDPNATGANDSFTYINFSTAGGSDNSLNAIDEIVFSGSDEIYYMALDNFQWLEIIPCVAPTAQATSAVFGSETSSTVNLTSFTAPAGGADGYAVYINDSNSFTAPINGVEPTVDVTWNGSGQQPVYFGTSASPNITVSNLAPGTTYYFQVYAYDDCYGTETYETTGLTSNDVTALGVITVTGLTGNNKVYDATTGASASGTALLSGVASGANNVSLSGTPTFIYASSNVGNGITISTTGYSLSGTDAAKYTLTQPTLSGNITAKEVTITGLTGDNKVYDSTTAATASGTAALSGVIGADDVSLGGSPVFTFASANAGTGITINTSGYTISGTESGNYTLTQPTLSGDITSPSLTWTGATSNDWNTASNWNVNFVPPSSANVTIPVGLSNYPTISSPVTVNSIKIASGASLIANAAVTGEVTYTRNLPTTNWYLVAPPVSGETLEDLTTHDFALGSGSNIGIGTYINNGPTAWTYANINTTGPVISGMGISMKLRNPGDVFITGTLNTSDVSVPISTGSRDGFNLIGNPYTSYINSNNFTFESYNSLRLTEETVWLWDGVQYVTSNYISPIEIAPGQGFFVEAATNSSLIFHTANQSHQGSDTFMRQTPKTTFELFLTQGKTKRSTKVFYVEGKTTGFDNGYDSKMFGSITHDVAVFTQLVTDDTGKKLAIQTLPNSNYESMVIPVGLIAKAGQKLTISAQAMNLPSGIEVYLEDRTNGVFTNLSKGNYTLKLAKDANGIGQFYLHTSSKALSTGAISQNVENVSIYKSSTSTLTIVGLQTQNAIMSIYSVLGKEVFVSNFASNGVSNINIPNLATGVYIVNVNSELGKVSKKVIIE